MQGTGESSIAQSHTLVNKDTIDRRESELRGDGRARLELETVWTLERQRGKAENSAVGATPTKCG